MPLKTPKGWSSRTFSGKIDQEAVATAVKALKKKVRAEVAVAGGITPSTARSLAEAGADILVVGSAIYAASDPGAAAKEILEATRSR